MRPSLLLVSVLCLLLLPLAAWARIPSGVVTPISAARAAQVPFERLAEMVSVPGEGKVTFMKRVGQRLTAYAQHENVEFCARVASRYVPQTADSGYTLYGVVITTNHAHLVCVDQDLVPDGFTATGQTIHNHGLTPRFRANEADVALTGRQFRLNQVVGTRVQDAFSPQDLLAAGYLATPTGLLYQDGQGHQRDLGDYEITAERLVAR